MTNGKPAGGQAGGLQTVGKNLPGEVKKKAEGEFVEMQELLPVMATFQEHLAAEQSRNRSRMRSIFVLFAILFAAFLAVPVYMGKTFLEQSRLALSGQKAAQEELARSLSGSMESLAQASRELRAELARQRELRSPAMIVAEPAVPAEATAPTVPAAEAVPAPVPPAPVVETLPAAALADPAPAQPEEPASPPAVEKPVVAEMAPEPAKGPAPKEGGAELETLLKQVERAIEEKERELKTRKK